MEELPQAPRCDCQSIVWVPPTDQWADREKYPGHWSFPANLLPRPPALLEPVYWLGRIRPELPLSTNHWTQSLPVCARFSATFVPLGRGTIRCTCSRLLVPERVWDKAHHHLRAMGRRKLTADLRRSDSPPYQPGQKVWLSTRDIRLHLPCKKLAPRYIGPFIIQKQINLVTFQFKLPPQYRIQATHIPRLTSQTLSLSCLSIHRAWPDYGTPSPADSGGWSGLRGQNHLGFPTSWWSAGIPRRLGGVWTGGEVMDSQRRHPGSSSNGGIPLELPQSPKTKGRPPRRRVPRPSGASRGEGG